MPVLRAFASCLTVLMLLSGAALAQTSTGTLTGSPTPQFGTMNFGTQAVGTAGPAQTETLTAHIVPAPAPPGTVVQIKSVSTNSGEFAITGGNCAGALLPDGTGCSLQIAFTPAAGGNRASFLSIQCAITAVVGAASFACDDAVHQFLALSGIGAAAALNPIPTLGREGLTLLALVLFASALWHLRRRGR
jgi:hypothetical protein